MAAVDVSVLAGVLAAYLVVTALTTVRPPAAGARWLGLGAMLVAMAVALTGITWRGFLGVGALVGDELGYRLPLAYREESAVHFPRKPI